VVGRILLSSAQICGPTPAMKRYLCLGCGFLYDEALGLPEFGIAAGTRWEDIPDDWVCPDCGTPKSLFEMVEITY
jgi:rubredoxin